MITDKMVISRVIAALSFMLFVNNIPYIQGSSYKDVTVISQIENPCMFPTFLPIIIHEADEHTHIIHLKRSSAIPHSVPLYITKSNTDDDTPKVLPLDNHRIASYQDTEQQAAFIIECIHREDDITVQWHGEFTLNDEETYHVKHNGDLNQHQLHYIGKYHRQHSTNKEEKHTFTRTKRESKTPIHIEILVVTDHLIYQRFYSQSNKSSPEERKNDARTQIKTYYAFILNSMNLRYKNIVSEAISIDISLVGYFISESESASKWFKLSVSPFPADVLLNGFGNWLNRTTTLPPYDHAILFTGFTLTNTDSTLILGRAFLGHLCSSKSQSSSIVQDEGKLQSTTTTATHELGHSMGADHDEISGCSARNRFIMAGTDVDVTVDNKLNSWLFSNCSVKAFETYIQKLTSTGSEKEKECLTTVITPTENQVINITHLMPGQVYDPDVQCRQIYGARSFYNWNLANLTEICTDMHCYNPSTTLYSKIQAARGTSCEPSKWCLDGHCKRDPDAPTDVQMCADHPNVSFHVPGGDVIRTCPSLLENYPSTCYKQTSCCDSCSKLRTSISGCEFGDKIYGCNKSDCNQIHHDGYNYNEVCCGTCDHHPSNYQCEDNNEAQCKTKIDQYGNGAPCYNFTFAFHCCKTCRNIRNISNKSCEYGDTDSQQWCNSNTKNGTINCNTYGAKCCSMCPRQVSKGHIGANIMAIIFVMVGFVHILHNIILL